MVRLPAHLVDAGHDCAIPLDAELHVLVVRGNDAIDGKLRHGGVLLRFRSGSGRPSAASVSTTNSAGFSGAKPMTILTMPRIDVVLRRCCSPVALDEIRVACGAGALEGTLAEQVVHEGADIEADLCPQRFIIGLEDRPLRGRR